MGRREKLIDRFRSIPADFTWNELCAVLSGMGYERLKGRGSRRKFRKAGRILILHEPHPGTIVKKYVLRSVLKALKDSGEIK
jgi:predicted RNA binding protein YcfA (HicA-like mRNA interferase family)